MLDIPRIQLSRTPLWRSWTTVPRTLLGSETSSTVSSRGVYKFPAERKADAKYEDHQSSSYDLEYCSWSNIPDIDFALADDHQWTLGQFVWTGFDYLRNLVHTIQTHGPTTAPCSVLLTWLPCPKTGTNLYPQRMEQASWTLHIFLIELGRQRRKKKYPYLSIPTIRQPNFSSTEKLWKTDEEQPKRRKPLPAWCGTNAILRTGRSKKLWHTMSMAQPKLKKSSARLENHIILNWFLHASHSQPTEKSWHT